TIKKNTVCTPRAVIGIRVISIRWAFPKSTTFNFALSSRKAVYHTYQKNVCSEKELKKWRRKKNSPRVSESAMAGIRTATVSKLSKTASGRGSKKKRRPMLQRKKRMTLVY